MQKFKSPPAKLDADDLARLSEVFRRYADVQAVYLFGSMATGKTHKESDIDLALVPRSPALHQQHLDILADFVREGFDRVDVIFLDTKNLVLKFEAVRQNRVIYQTEDFERGAYFSKIARAYWDFQPYLRAQREALKRRILNGQG